MISQSKTMSNLTPPFNEDQQVVTGPNIALTQTSPKPRLMLPAVFETKHQLLRVIQPIETNRNTFLAQDLDLARLNKIHKHLWIAGLPQPPRPLHNQVQIGRAIRITERADMHMLWIEQLIYLKPLPMYLLCHDIWTGNLCNDIRLYNAAIGFLLSYIWLVISPSDFKIAIDQGLLEPSISWDVWSTFVKDFIAKGATSWGVNPRFHFGELRLSRIDWAYRFCAVARRDGGSLVRGYYYAYHDYETFLKRNLTWLLTAFVYMALVLTAMQVGLATDHLKNNAAFQAASWGFTIFTILAPLVVVAIVLCYVLFVVLKNFFFTTSTKGKPGPNDPVWRDITINPYQH